MWRVLVVDDHPAVRFGVRGMLEASTGFAVVGEAANATEALATAAALRPDVALVDLRLGHEDGAELIAALGERAPATRCLVLTTYDGDEAIHRALSAGARGYILKHSSADEMQQAIRHVAAGRRFIPADVAHRLVANGPRVVLTARERDVLDLLAEGLRNKEIGGRLGMGEATVRTHVQAIIGKFGCHDRGAAIAHAIARGFFATQMPLSCE